MPVGLVSVGKFLSAVGARAMKKAAHDIVWRACKPFARDLRIKLINGNPWALRAPSYGDTFYSCLAGQKPASKGISAGFSLGERRTVAVTSRSAKPKQSEGGSELVMTGDHLDRALAELGIDAERAPRAISASRRGLCADYIVLSQQKDAGERKSLVIPNKQP